MGRNLDTWWEFTSVIIPLPLISGSFMYVLSNRMMIKPNPFNTEILLTTKTSVMSTSFNIMQVEDLITYCCKSVSLSSLLITLYISKIWFELKLGCRFLVPMTSHMIRFSKIQDYGGVLEQVIMNLMICVCRVRTVYYLWCCMLQ
jgi:hypothetical protein